MIELRQYMTVIYKVTYTRDRVIELLQSAGVEDDLSLSTDAELGQRIQNIVNRDDNGGLTERLTDDAGDWFDSDDIGDWFVIA